MILDKSTIIVILMTFSPFILLLPYKFISLLVWVKAPSK